MNRGNSVAKLALKSARSRKPLENQQFQRSNSSLYEIAYILSAQNIENRSQPLKIAVSNAKSKTD